MMKMNSYRCLPRLVILGLFWLVLGNQLLRADAEIDAFMSGGAKVALPGSMMLKVKPKDGRVLSGDASGNATNAQLVIPILRCVTSHHPDAHFPNSGSLEDQTYLQRAVLDGVVTQQCRVTLYLFIERLPKSPDGTITLSNLRFNQLPGTTNSNVSTFQLNGQNAGLLTTPLVMGMRADAASESNWNVITFMQNSTNINFGLPSFTPDDDMDQLYQLSENAQTRGQISPQPGINTIYMGFKSDPSVSSGLKTMQYQVHLYGMIEFGAMAPIVFIHGTNASHTTWEEPTIDSNETSNLTGDGGQKVTLDNSRMVDPTCPSCGLNGKYAGPWFYKIDLGPAKLTSYDKDNSLRSGFDRYADLPVSSVDLVNDGNGNASNQFSAAQLRVLLPLVLQMYGMDGDNWAHATCHLVAHSKGGSDCRYLITKLLNQSSEQSPGKSPFRVLGFFSLDTPFRGTPVSDIAYALGQDSLFVPTINQGGSPVVAANIAAAVNSVSSTILAGKSPHGAALKDQRYQPDGSGSGIAAQNIDIKAWNDFNQHKGQYFSLAGDADIDGDRMISGEESKILAPATLYGLGMTSVYQMVATVNSNLVLRLEPVINGTGIQNTLIVLSGSPFGSWMPNDLVVPYSSCLPGELEGRAPPNRSGSSFRVTFRQQIFNNFAVKRHLRGGDYADIDPGNHSMQKNPAVIDGIIRYLKQYFQPILPSQS